jgi:type IV pilus assembly protein PilM
MFGLLKKQSYGLQIYDGGIKFAAMNYARRDQLQCTTLEHIPFDTTVIRNGKLIDEEAFVRALHVLKEKLSLQKISVNVTIPTANILVRKTKVASLSHPEMRNLIDLELHSGDKLPFKNPVFDFVRIDPTAQIAPEVDVVKQEEVLVFATPEESVEAYVRAIQTAGFHVDAVDISALSLFRLFVSPLSRLTQDLPDSFMMLECTAEQADVSIFTDGVPVFIRSISITASNAFESEVERRQQFITSLITELSRILNYYKFSISSDFSDIQSIYFAGEITLADALRTPLKDELNAELHTIVLESFIEHEEKALDSNILCECSAAIGLALKGIKG